MKKKYWAMLLTLTLFAIMFLSSCTYSQYILRLQYINPNNQETEVIDVPVSQYSYDNTDVGDFYSVDVKTSILGSKVPVTTETSTTGLQMTDILPLIIAAISIYLGAGALFSNKPRKEITVSIILSLITMMFAVGLMATNQPEFTATGTIIDKTFQITS